MLQHHNNLNNLIRERERETRNLSNNNKHLSFYSLYSCYLNQFKSAFSLVELSIVLIIIGLLISAVIGGRALIDEAKFIIIRNEFEEYKNALHQYYLAGRSFFAVNPAWPPDFMCNGQLFIDLVDMGYLDKSKYILSGWSSLKSKIKGINGAGFLLWNNNSCAQPTTWNYGYDTNKKAKTFLNYAYTAEGKGTNTDGFLSPQFCDKLVKKLRSFYKEDTTQPSTQYNPEKVNKYMFYCACRGKINGSLYGSSCGDFENSKQSGAKVTDVGAYLRAVIFDF